MRHYLTTRLTVFGLGQEHRNQAYQRRRLPLVRAAVATRSTMRITLQVRLEASDRLNRVEQCRDALLGNCRRTPWPIGIALDRFSSRVR